MRNPIRTREILADPNDHSHGTPTGYTYGCRCERCREAVRLRARRRAEDMRGKSPIADVPEDERHGTYNGYGNLWCRCERCKEANRIRVRDQNQSRLEGDVPNHVHGTVNGYNNYGCRCLECTTANTLARRKTRESK